MRGYHNRNKATQLFCVVPGIAVFIYIFLFCILHYSSVLLINLFVKALSILFIEIILSWQKILIYLRERFYGTLYDIFAYIQTSFQITCLLHFLALNLRDLNVMVW